MVFSARNLLFSSLVCSMALAIGHSASQAKSSGTARVHTRDTLASKFSEQLKNTDNQVNLGLVYWIELIRDGKVYRANNLVQFKSGDQIRFHVLPNADSYAYILLKEGTSGNSCVLFPHTATGADNFVKGGYDCVVPTQGALEFDENPGIEHVGLLLSRSQVDSKRYLHYPVHKTVSVKETGSQGKVLKRSRTRLVTDSKAVLVPLLAPAIEEKQKPVLVEEPHKLIQEPGLMIVVSDDPGSVISANIALKHLK